jgi:Protein of unknown function (DUF3311)
VSDPRTPAPSRGLWIAICVILLPAIVLPLWVPLYDKVDPRLNGWPFFFWFQMAMILGATALTVLAYALSRVADRRDREARGQRGDRS